MALKEREKGKNYPKQWMQSGCLNIVQVQPERKKDGEQIKKLRYEKQREHF